MLGLKWKWSTRRRLDNRETVARRGYRSWRRGTNHHGWPKRDMCDFDEQCGAMLGLSSRKWNGFKYHSCVCHRIFLRWRRWGSSSNVAVSTFNQHNEWHLWHTSCTLNKRWIWLWGGHLLTELCRHSRLHVELGFINCNVIGHLHCYCNKSIRCELLCSHI